MKGVAKQQVTPAQQEHAEVSMHSSPVRAEAPPGAPGEDASRYCPVCSQRLESRRCKLVCPVCGYYMSCADYY